MSPKASQTIHVKLRHETNIWSQLHDVPCPQCGKMHCWVFDTLRVCELCLHWSIVTSAPITTSAPSNVLEFIKALRDLRHGK